MMAARPLTKKQLETLAALREYQRTHGRMPTCAQLGRIVGVSTVAGVWDRLKGLEKRGLVAFAVTRDEPWIRLCDGTDARDVALALADVATAAESLLGLYETHGAPMSGIWGALPVAMEKLRATGWESAR